MKNVRQLDLFAPVRDVGRGDQLFLKGPVDWEWLCLAASQPGRALQVALALQLLVGMKKHTTVRLGRTYPAQLGLDRYAQYRGLKALERAGLVRVERKPGRSPAVTVIPVGGTTR